MFLRRPGGFAPCTPTGAPLRAPVGRCAPAPRGAGSGNTGGGLGEAPPSTTHTRRARGNSPGKSPKGGAPALPAEALRNPHPRGPGRQPRQKPKGRSPRPPDGSPPSPTPGGVRGGSPGGGAGGGAPWPPEDRPHLQRPRPAPCHKISRL
ncbi:hypothetical protein GCM10027168_36190 [Streptomyces capparidis]